MTVNTMTDKQQQPPKIGRKWPQLRLSDEPYVSRGLPPPSASVGNAPLDY
jgi:hypothetical protein